MEAIPKHLARTAFAAVVWTCYWREHVWNTSDANPSSHCYVNDLELTFQPESIMPHRLRSIVVISNKRDKPTHLFSLPVCVHLALKIQWHQGVRGQDKGGKKIC